MFSSRKFKRRFSVDLRDKCPPIYDQGNIKSCVVNALCFMYKYYSKTNFDPSRMNLYNNVRKNKRNIGYTVESAMKILTKIGVLAEKYHPYDMEYVNYESKYNTIQECRKHRITGYISLNRVKTDLIACLREGHPFIFTTIRNGSPHTMVCVGYDYIKEEFIIANSVGTTFGNKGYFNLSWHILVDNTKSFDFYRIDSVIES